MKNFNSKSNPFELLTNDAQEIMNISTQLNVAISSRAKSMKRIMDSMVNTVKAIEKKYPGVGIGDTAVHEAIATRLREVLSEGENSFDSPTTKELVTMFYNRIHYYNRASRNVLG